MSKRLHSVVGTEVATHAKPQFAPQQPAEPNAHRFLIDGSMVHGGGGFTYLVNVVPELARLAPRDHFLVAVADLQVAESIPSAENVEIRFLGQLGWRGRLLFNYWQASRLAADWGADVYFSACDSAPLKNPCPTIVAFRNANVFTLGRGQRLPIRQRTRFFMLHALARLSAAKCDRALFVSEDSARWIGDSIGLAERKRSVIHHGIDAGPWRAAEPARMGDRGYILSVSSIYPYKNYVRLIQAYRELAERHPDLPDLVIIGDDQDPPYSRRMERARLAAGRLAESIHILGEVPHSEIRPYYRGASLFVFPSYLETFGHPLLEAMASDVPLVAADIPVSREVAAEAALYADPMDSSSLARVMETVLFEPGVAERLVQRGRERLERFTWRRTAEQLLALLEAMIEERADRGAGRDRGEETLAG